MKNVNNVSPNNAKIISIYHQMQNVIIVQKHLEVNVNNAVQKNVMNTRNVRMYMRMETNV